MKSHHPSIGHAGGCPITPRRCIGWPDPPPWTIDILGGVQAGGKNDVPLDGCRGRLHLLEQRRVAHDARSVHQLAALLVQAHDAAHNAALHDVRQPADLLEGRAHGPLVHHLQGRGEVLVWGCPFVGGAKERGGCQLTWSTT